MRRSALTFALIAGLSIPCGAEPQRSAAEIVDILMWAPEQVGGPFALIDHTGTSRTERDFRGKLLLVYFGFTYCPDVCPTDLQNIGLALDRLGAVGDKVQPLFVTVDPERDTPAHLADCVPMFHPRLIGLTGDAAAIRAAADAYKVYYAKVPRERGDDYTVDHTAFIYLIGTDGEYLGFFPPGTAPERIADTLRQQAALNHWASPPRAFCCSSWPGRKSRLGRGQRQTWSQIVDFQIRLFETSLQSNKLLLRIFG